jgi:hypothetical protein
MLRKSGDIVKHPLTEEMDISIIDLMSFFLIYSWQSVIINFRWKKETNARDVHPFQGGL